MAKYEPETLRMAEALVKAGLKPEDAPEIKKLVDAAKAKPATGQKAESAKADEAEAEEGEDEEAPKSWWDQLKEGFQEESARLEAKKGKKKPKKA